MYYTPFYGGVSKRCVVLEVHRNMLHRSPRHAGSTTPPGDQTLYRIECEGKRVWTTSTHLTFEQYEAHEDLIVEHQLFDRGDVIYHSRLERHGIITNVTPKYRELPWSNGREVYYVYEIMVGMEKSAFDLRTTVYRGYRSNGTGKGGSFNYDYVYSYIEKV